MPTVDLTPRLAREAHWPEAVSAIRLLALTGRRRGEVLNLRWRDIGADAINLPDGKMGPRAAPLGEAAHRRAARRAESGRVPVSAIRARPSSGQPCRLLAVGLHGCKAWQIAPS